MKHLFLFRTRRSSQPEAVTPTWASAGLAKVGLWIVLGAAMIFAAGRLVIFAAECGTIDNTFWRFTAASSATKAAVDGTNIYLVAGDRISILDMPTGVETVSNTFLGVTLGRPIVASLKGASNEVIVAGDIGYLYGLNGSTLITNWTRSTLRGSCRVHPYTVLN